ncbi:MAG TPA: hypothetical protein VG890_11420, partial [Puia sp.]|nr:hypothetical protein [Puia sp.]
LGPHLHFEIREYPADINLNPMLFGLPIPDNTPPVVRKLALYDRDKSVYEQSPALYTVKGSAGHYSISQPLIYSGASQIGFAISGFDTQSGSSNPNGIYQAQVFDNGKPVSGFRMNRISYNDTRGVNAHIDYRIRAAGGPYYQLLFELPGYAHSIYKQKADGKIGLGDGAIHNIRIELKDANGNTSNLSFKVQYRASSKPAAIKEEGKLFRPMMLDGIETDDCAFYLGERSLYDSVHLSCRAEPAGLPAAVSRLQHIGNREIPIQDSVLVRIKLLKPVNKKQVLMQWSDREDQEVRAVQWQGDWATASFRNFGNFQLVYDTVPPVISFPGISDNANLSGSSRLAVSVRDNFKQVRRFRATLDGNWLLFTNDKAKDFIYTFDEHCVPGKHELKVTAEDEAGNVSEAVLHFTR